MADDDRISRAIHSLYSSAERRAGWQDALGGVASLVRAQRLSVFYVPRGRPPEQDTWPFNAGGLIEYTRDYAHRDLRLARVLEGRRGLLSTRDLMTEEEIARCPVHQEFCRRHPECWNTLACTVEDHQALIVPLIQRSAVWDAFDATEGDILRVVSGHIAAAARLRQLLPEPLPGAEELRASLDAFDEALVLLDTSGASGT